MSDESSAASTRLPSFIGTRTNTRGSDCEVLPVLFWDWNSMPDSKGFFFCLSGEWDLRPGDRVSIGITDDDEPLYEVGTVREAGAVKERRFVRVELDSFPVTA